MPDHFQSVIDLLKSRQDISPLTVVVPNMRFKDVFSRKVVFQEKNAKLLYNVRFQTSGSILSEMLTLLEAVGTSAGSVYHPLALHLLLWETFRNPPKGLRLEYYDFKQLRIGPGYAKAIAAVIAELDMAGLKAQDLRKVAQDKERFSDIAKIWEFSVNELRKRKQNQQGQGEVISKIVQKLREKEFTSRVVKMHGSVIWISVPTQFLHHQERLLIEAVVKNVPQSRHFEIPQGDLSQAASKIKNRDTSLQEWNGIDGEMQAAVEWVRQRLLQPPSHEGVQPDIALICDSAMSSKLFSSLERAVPAALIENSFGQSADCSPEGVRWLALLGALNENLSCYSMIKILPWLTSEKDGDKEFFRWDRSKWMDAITGTGTVGGSVSDVGSAQEWKTKLLAKNTDAKPYEPSLLALLNIHGLVQKKAPLETLSNELFQFVEKHLRLPVLKTTVTASLKEEMEQLLADGFGGFVSGAEVLSLFEELLGSLVVKERNKAARVLLGSHHAAAGLPFESVRFVGMAEGVFPPTVREDAVLNDQLRSVLSDNLRLSTHRSRYSTWAIKSLLAFHPPEVVLSSHYQNAAGNERTHSNFYYEWARAMVDGKESLRPFLEQKLQKAHILESQALKERPRSETEAGCFDIATALQKHLEDQDPASTGGYFGVNKNIQIPSDRLPGLTSKRTISPSSAGKILDCPKSFMLEKILKWERPSSLPDLGADDALLYGNVLHDMAANAYDEDFKGSIKPKDLPKLKSAELNKLAEKLLNAAIAEHPATAFWGQADESHRFFDKLKKSLIQILKMDLGNNLQAVSSEIEMEGTISVSAKNKLHIKGTTDRIESRGAGGKRKWVIDLKSGKGKTEEGLLPSYDIQVLLYYRLAKELGKLNEKDLEGLGFCYPENLRAKRDFQAEDLSSVLAAGEEWLKLIHELIRSQNFVNTTDEEKCKYCAYKPVCGEKSLIISKARLQASRDDLSQSLLAIWGVDDGKD